MLNLQIRLIRLFALLGIIALAGMSMTQDWVLFSAPQATVLFPKQTVLDSSVVDNGIMKLKFYVGKYMVKDTANDDNLLYAYVSTEFPDSSISSTQKDVIDSYFEGAVSSTVEKMNGQLLSEEKIELDGFPGRKIRVAMQNKQLMTTQYHWLVRNAGVIIQITHKADKEDNPNARRFFSSIKLK